MRGSLVVGAGILVGNLTGFLRVVVTAYLLGTHARADALAVALGPIDVLNTAIISTMLVAFVPLLVAQNELERAGLFARACKVFPAILAALAAAIALCAPTLISLLGPGLAAAQHDEAVSVLRLIAPAVFFAGTAAVFAALLYTERRFLVPALYQACVNGGMMAGALLLWSFFGVNAFALGYTIGAALQLLLTWLVSRDLRRRQHHGSRVPLRVILTKPALFLLYAGLIALNILTTRAFATHAGAGMAAAFDYCLRCVSVVVAYLVYPVANSLLPEVARLRAINNSAHAYRLIDRSTVVMGGLAVLACITGILLRKPAIALLFERGSFNSDSTAMVSSVFLGFAPAIIGWALLDLMSRCSFALDRPLLPLLCALLPVGVNFAVLKLLPVTATSLATGASAGLLTGFAALFAASHLRRRDICEGTLHQPDIRLGMEQDLQTTHTRAD